MSGLLERVCGVCGRPVLGIPWHDLPREPTHQVCAVQTSGALRAARQHEALHRGRAEDLDGWTIGLHEDSATVLHETGREVSLTWARLRTVAIGNLEIVLRSSLPCPDRPAGPPRPLAEVLAELGLASGIVAPEEVVGALGRTDGERLQLMVPWSVPPEVISLASRLVGRVRRRT